MTWRNRAAARAPDDGRRTLGIPLNTTLARWALALSALAVTGALAGWLILRPVPVAMVSVAAGQLAAQVAGPGTVQARVPVTLSARLTSTVTRIAVDVGDAVQRGQILVLLDDGDLVARRSAVQRQRESVSRQVEAAAASVAKARADANLAQARAGRDADLHAQSFLSRASLDASVASVRSAEAALSNAQALLAARRADHAAAGAELAVAGLQAGYTRLAAPMAGVVVQRFVEPGSTVGPGTPILRLVDPQTLWVAARIDEALVARVAVGQAATIRLRSGQVLAGRVARIAMQSDAATRELEVDVGFTQPPARIAIDQEAEVRIEVGSEQGIVVPLAAVLRDAAGATGVLRVVQGRAHFAPVRLGPEAGGSILVRDGLRAGDELVASAAQVSAGARVRRVAP